MNVLRYSAIPKFGVPMDSLKNASGNNQLTALLSAYSIEGMEVTTELTDITPYYWRNPNFRYYLSRENERGPVVVDIMPRHRDSSAFIVTGMGREGLMGIETPDRTIEIPTDQAAMGILGPGPRFAGQICLHELIVHL
jgi:hypothetical protein